jgi:hypothetical protein
VFEGIKFCKLLQAWTKKKMALSVQEKTIVRMTVVVRLGSEPGPHIPPSTERFGIFSYLSTAKVFAGSSKKTGNSMLTPHSL